MNLTTGNIPSYLQQHRLISRRETPHITEIPTNVNHIFRIETPTQHFILKQAMEKLARFPTIPISIKRVDTEYRAIQMWKKVCNSHLQISIPMILHYDKENNLVIFKAAPKEATILTNELLAGVVKVEVVRKLAEILASVHNSTFGNKILKKEFSNYIPWIDIKLGFFHQHMLAEEKDKQVQKAIKNLMNRTISNKVALIHADTNPKNILVYKNDILVIDHEFSCFGDPAYDVACLLAHYYLSGIIHYNQRQKYFQAIEEFWKVYERKSNLPRRMKLKMKRNIIQHFGPMLWCRAFGKAKVSFLHDKTKEFILRASKEIVTGNFTYFKDLFSLAEKHQNVLSSLPSIDIRKAQQEVTF